MCAPRSVANASSAPFKAERHEQQPHLTATAALLREAIAAGAMLAAVGFGTVLVMNLMRFWP